MTPKTVGLIVFERMAATDLTGPAEAFSRARIQTPDPSEVPKSPPIGRTRPVASLRSCYRVLTLGDSTSPCATECGILIRPQLDLGEAPPIDTLLVSGGGGIHDARLSKKLKKWLKHRVPLTRRVVALGSGIYALAATGLLNGRQVAVHWSLAKDVAVRFPNLRINCDALFIKDDRFYTCAGGAAAFDLSLSLIEEDFGRQSALNLAREFVLHFKRPGEEEQYSEALRFQVQSTDRFADLPAWIHSHLGSDLSIDTLAQRAAMSRRNFTRLFHETFGKTPAQFVAEARIAEAQKRLLVPRNSIEGVADSLGFQSADVFSVAFERQTGIRPRTYRALKKASKNNGSASRKSGKNAKPPLLRVA
jgi:transcriptional regulator GlxA family with amidase domain